MPDKSHRDLTADQINFNRETWFKEGSTVYSLTEKGFKAGKPDFVNRFTITAMGYTGSTQAQVDRVTDELVELMNVINPAGEPAYPQEETCPWTPGDSMMVTDDAIFFLVPATGQIKPGHEMTNLIRLQFQSTKEADETDLSRYLNYVASAYRGEFLDPGPEENEGYTGETAAFKV